jgi:general secretion pathway protein E
MEAPENRHLSDEEKWDILTRPEKLGEILLKQGKLTLSQLEDLIKQQEHSGMPLGELILSKGIMSRSDLLTALDWQHKTDQVIIDSLTELINKHKKEPDQKS